MDDEPIISLDGTKTCSLENPIKENGDKVSQAFQLLSWEEKVICVADSFTHMYKIKCTAHTNIIPQSVVFRITLDDKHTIWKFMVPKERVVTINLQQTNELVHNIYHRFSHDLAKHSPGHPFIIQHNPHGKP